MQLLHFFKDLRGKVFKKHVDVALWTWFSRHGGSGVTVVILEVFSNLNKNSMIVKVLIALHCPRRDTSSPKQSWRTEIKQ